MAEVLVSFMEQKRKKVGVPCNKVKRLWKDPCCKVIVVFGKSGDCKVKVEKDNRRCKSVFFLFPEFYGRREND